MPDPPSRIRFGLCESGNFFLLKDGGGGGGGGVGVQVRTTIYCLTL